MTELEHRPPVSLDPCQVIRHFKEKIKVLAMMVCIDRITENTECKHIKFIVHSFKIFKLELL